MSCIKINSKQLHKYDINFHDTQIARTTFNGNIIIMITGDVNPFSSPLIIYIIIIITITRIDTISAATATSVLSGPSTSALAGCIVKEKREIEYGKRRRDQYAITILYLVQ